MTRPDQNYVSAKPCLLCVSPRKEEQRFRSEAVNFALTICNWLMGIQSVGLSAVLRPIPQHSPDSVW